MASVIVVDNELRDSVKEYGQIIDGIQKTTEFSQSIAPFLQAEDITDKAELLTKINEISTSETFKKFNDKEFEAAFYLFIHIVSELSSREQTLDNVESPVFKTLLEVNPVQQPSLRDRKSIKPITVLSILTIIFNLLPETSKTRIYIISQILNVVSSSGIEFSLIQDNIGSKLISWLKKAGAQESEIRTIFWRFITLDNKFTKESLHLIKSFTTEYQVTSGELNQLINFALSSEVVDVSFLVNNNVAQALNQEQTPASTLFRKYVHGEIVSATEELSSDSINYKSKILNLAKYFADSSASPDHDDIIFKYSEIPNIQSSTEFEQLLLEAIKAGVVEGKLNQVEEVFYLSRVNRFVIAGEDNTQAWAAVRETLQQWKNSLTNINDVVKAARENIVNSGN
ncbi:Eukaryotic translation initiation factor 3 subunit M [Spathaspora sp. JA1]|nr:Eukaryotic translation initiation factor 3 subunit M [Spathaspora sp. JA1]